MNICLNCNTDTSNPKFCSKSCSAIYNNKKYPKKKPNKMPFCMWCGDKLGKNAKVCCSRSCNSMFKLHININKWKLGIDNGIRGNDQIKVFIRKYLFKKYNNKCMKCGWNEVHQYTGLVPLTIHHKDGDCMNNKEENLELLCPNCHCLTDNFGALNINNTTKRKSTYR